MKVRTFMTAAVIALGAITTSLITAGSASADTADNNNALAYDKSTIVEVQPVDAHLPSKFPLFVKAT